MDKLELDDTNTGLFQRLLEQVGKVTSVPAAQGTSRFEWGDVALELVPMAVNRCKAAVLFVFTLTGFRIADPATLAQLLNYNRNLLQDCELPACFCLDPSGAHVQFQQRMLLDEMPLWTLQRYIEDSVERLRDLFVLVLPAPQS